MIKEENGMNILVTGGGGYLGRYIIDCLRAEGHRVINYCRDLTLPGEDEDIVPVLGELYDIPRFAAVIKEYAVDRIIHTAAQSHPVISVMAPLQTAESNVMGTVSVLEAARMTGIKRVVLFSSEAAYGEHGDRRMTLDVPLIPRTPYGVTKAACEMFGRAYNWSFGMECVSIRCSQVYGPRHLTQEYVRDAIKAGIQGLKYILPRGIDHKIQMIHVRDAADVTVKACFAKKVNDMAVYNASSGYQPSFGEILVLLKKMIPGFEYEVGPGNFGSEQQGIFDLEDTAKDLGYIPQVGLEQGLKEYVDWLRSHDI